jgi:hypothetical protein
MLALPIQRVHLALFPLQPELDQAADGFVAASLHTIETSAAEEQCQAALANALRTGFRNFKSRNLLRKCIAQRGGSFCSKVYVFLVIQCGAKTEPKTAVKNPFRYNRTKTPA